MAERLAQYAVIGGTGKIGREVIRQAGKPAVAARYGWDPDPIAITNRHGAFLRGEKELVPYQDFGELGIRPDLVFMTVPSDQHEFEFQHEKYFLESGATVITAAKGGMAYYPRELRDLSNNFFHLGVRAAVGGGTRLMVVGEELCRDKANISQIHLALNGTLNAIMSGIGPRGEAMSIGQSVEQASELKFAEPSEEGEEIDHFEVIRAEAEGDVPKKVSIFLNALGFFEEPIKWTDIDIKLADGDIAEAQDNARVRRFIVSIYPKWYQMRHKRYQEKGIIGEFEMDYPDVDDPNSWHIVAGFRDVETNPLFYRLGDLSGPGNGIVVGLGPGETDGIYAYSGPGAGPRPTANAMLDDYLSKIQPSIFR